MNIYGSLMDIFDQKNKREAQIKLLWYFMLFQAHSLCIALALHYLCTMNSEIVFQIEKELQFSPHTHKDFVELSNFIVDKTKQYLSATTLKRVWGAKNDHHKPSSYTLNVLARTLGYSDYEHFCIQKKKIISEIFASVYFASGLTLGDEIQLTWEPDRLLVLRYLDNEQFQVIASENGKLFVGDTVRAQCFIEGESITFSHVMHAGKGPFAYVAGKKSGIHVIPLNNEV